MPPPTNVRLGPRTRKALEGAAWRNASKYPAHQPWADELEQLLAFLEAQAALDKFLPRLQAREREMQAALAEARAGFFFCRNGFRILGWAPEEVSGRPGDLEIQWLDTEPIFVEVKAPGWESELTQRERLGSRKDLPKNINLEPRAIAPHERVVYAVLKALPKFAENRANLVVVHDDLFVSPLEFPMDHLRAVVEKCRIS